MKKVIFLLTSLYLFTSPVFIYANTPNFTNEEEIDNYYDNQKEQIRNYYEGKIEDVYQWRDEELEKTRKWKEDETVKIYKKYLGDNLTWDMIGKYFPENNPNAEEVYWDVLNYPTVDGISKLKIVFFANLDLYNELLAIDQKRKDIDNANKTNTTANNNNIKREESKKDLTKDGSYDNDSVINTKNTEIEKERSSGDINILEENKNIDNMSMKTEEPTKEETTVKLKWYQKIFNWFRK